VPDYLTSVKESGFYGWPHSNFGQYVDDRVEPQNPELVAKAMKTNYSLGSHVAALGLASSTGTLLPEQFRHGVFIGQHGSWNREPRSGYNVVFVPFQHGQPAGMPVEVLSLHQHRRSGMGRPVGVAMGIDGALLVADDVGKVVWRVTPKP
jgi:glucose/arabinose dehydrogenase